MNWRNIQNLSATEYDKPLLFKMPYDEDKPVNYFVGEICDGAVYASAYVDDYGNLEKLYIMPVEQIPSETLYLRIDEIKP